MPKQTKKTADFITGTPLSYADLVQLHTDILPVFAPSWDRAEENERYIKYQHWSKKQKADIEKTRQAYSFALIANKINTICALQRNTRTSFRVEAAQDPADDVKAELATIEMKDFERRAEFKYVESESFAQGVGVDYGAVEVYLDYKLVVWDVNSRDYLLRDALFIGKRRPRYRKDMRAEYGSIIDRISVGDAFSTNDRKTYNYFVSGSKSGNVEYDLITEITHYQRVKRTYFCALFDDYLNLNGMMNSRAAGKYRTRKEAEEKIAEMKIPYLSIGQRPGVSEVIRKVEDKLDKYVFTVVGILAYEETDLDADQCPLIVYRAFHLQDDWWTMTDLLKDPQIFLDRLISQIDYSLGTDVKNAYEINVEALAQNESPETAQRKITKSGGTVFKRGPERVVYPIESVGAKQQYFQLTAIMQDFVENLGGGRSFSGLEDQKGESGKAIALKQSQGQLIAELFIDNLMRWKGHVGQVVLDWIGKYQDAERTVKVAGDSLDDQMKALLIEKKVYEQSKNRPGTGFAFINQKGNPDSFLKDARLELVISEGELTETDSEQKLLQLLTYQKITGAPLPPEVVLQFIKMDASLKNKLVEASRAQAQAQQQQLQQAMGMEKEKMNIEKAKVLQDGMPKGMQ
jgi:hypothetical protein